MQNRKCGRCGAIRPENNLKRLNPTKYGFAFCCRECYDELKGCVDYTDAENRVIDYAVETTIRKYLEQGGKEERMESIDYIDYFFCMLLYDQGRQAVNNFVKNYTYNPSQRKQPVYYRG